jgi:hypothetical protein
MRTKPVNGLLAQRSLNICWTNELRVPASRFEASCAGVFRDAACVAQERNSWRTRDSAEAEQLPNSNLVQVIGQRATLTSPDVDQLMSVNSGSPSRLPETGKLDLRI